MGHSLEPWTDDYNRGLNTGIGHLEAARKYLRHLRLHRQDRHRAHGNEEKTRCVWCSEAAAGSVTDSGKVRDKKNGREHRHQLTVNFCRSIFPSKELVKRFQCSTVKWGFFSLKGNTLSTKATSFLAAASKSLIRISTKRIFQVINPKKNSSLFWTSDSIRRHAEDSECRRILVAKKHEITRRDLKLQC